MPQVGRAIYVDDTGNEYEVVVREDHLSAGTTSDPTATIAGMRERFLADGRRVTATDEPDALKIVATGAIILPK